MNYFDTHAHLGLLSEEAQNGVVERAVAAGVEGMVTVATTWDNFATQAAWAKQHENVWFSLGVHPHDAHLWREGKSNFDTYFSNGVPEKCVAIGEIGLDEYSPETSPHPVTPDQQAEAFLEQIALAKRWDLPVLIHCREAFPTLYRLLGEVGMPARGGILHCFTGTYEEAAQGVDFGFSVSFSGIVTFKNAGPLREVVRKLPLDRLLVETDCPYLAPVPFRGKPNEPSYLPHTVQVLAEARGENVSKVAQATTQNAKRIFRI